MAVTITIDDIKKARTYMPVETKQAIARLMAKLCVRAVENDAGSADVVLPPMRVEDRVSRLQCLHGVLCGWYLNASFEKAKLQFKDDSGETKEKEVAFCMSVEALDEWLDGHPMNQFERLKKEKQIANRVYDILYDLKAFELLLNGEIRDELDMANDPAIRIAQVLAVQTTPDSLRETLSLLEEYREKVGGEANA